MRHLQADATCICGHVISWHSGRCTIAGCPCRLSRFGAWRHARRLMLESAK